MNKIRIRKAKITDDLYSIARCIYLTDPYIYPSAFGSDQAKALKAIESLIIKRNGFFNINNILVALEDDKVCGMIIYNKNGTHWNTLKAIETIKDYISNVQDFIDASDYYFSLESISPLLDYIEIIACCVLPEYRNKGIAKQLLQHLINRNKDNYFTLDVLADNYKAIKLYESLGFKIEHKYNGFSGNIKESVLCYKMLKIN